VERLRPPQDLDPGGESRNQRISGLQFAFLSSSFCELLLPHCLLSSVCRVDLCKAAYFFKRLRRCGVSAAAGGRGHAGRASRALLPSGGGGLILQAGCTHPPAGPRRGVPVHRGPRDRLCRALHALGLHGLPQGCRPTPPPPDLCSLGLLVRKAHPR
jgi:hypothetical protein